MNFFEEILFEIEIFLIGGAENILIALTTIDSQIPFKRRNFPQHQLTIFNDQSLSYKIQKILIKNLGIYDRDIFHQNFTDPYKLKSFFISIFGTYTFDNFLEQNSRISKVMLGFAKK